MLIARDIHSPKPMMHVAYSPYFHKIYKFPYISVKFINFFLFSYNLLFCFIHVFFAPPYFDHDAFTHHALHILDASAHSRYYINFKLHERKQLMQHAKRVLQPTFYRPLYAPKSHVCASRHLFAHSFMGVIRGREFSGSTPETKIN